MSKSTYQKQKERIAKLEKDIRVLVENTDFVKAEMVRMEYQAKYNFEDVVFLGERKQCFGGIIQAIKSSELECKTGITIDQVNKLANDIFSSVNHPKKRHCWMGLEFLKGQYEQMGHEHFVYWLKDDTSNFTILTTEDGLKFIEEKLNQNNPTK